MKVYQFDLFLLGVAEVTDDHMDALFANGCDATPPSRDGVAWVHLDREAGSLEEAIRSAVTQVRSAGLTVAKVELDSDATATLTAAS